MLVQPIDGNFGLGPASGPSKPLTHTSTTALRQRRPFPPPGINPTVLVAFSKPSLKVRASRRGSQNTVREAFGEDLPPAQDGVAAEAAAITIS